MERPPRLSNETNELQGLVDDGKRFLAGRVAFGARKALPGQDLSAQLVHLSIIGAEVCLLLGEHAESDRGVVSLCSDNKPHLAICGSSEASLKVELDSETGFYVLHEDGGEVDCVLITSSEERLLDHIVGHLSGSLGDLAPKTVDGAIDALVGRSLEEVEWRLILKTLRHFRGELSSAAFSLGMSIETLQSQVNTQLLRRLSAAKSSEKGQ
ncbi:MULTISPECIES: helix-turn-helix domain-containing protein [Ciceribacter]|uniref:DNA binding HTH domain-containing protein n=1 Tax=Ciceribacter sichuanensis TaxID=2949647 RepID=A0AAJ1C1Q6_9HYPH|nr:MULTISPECIES: helix-turn-helix domain-containing protein [unclassified Ciceribacter]MCO5959820.1 hypothetical protein [Ciceribacter sp. S101]